MRGAKNVDICAKDAKFWGLDRAGASKGRKNLHIIMVRMTTRRIVAQDLLLRAKTLRHVDQFQFTISISRYEKDSVGYLEAYRRKEEFDNIDVDLEMGKRRAKKMGTFKPLESG
jgi:hypothetical protein